MSVPRKKVGKKKQQQNRKDALCVSELNILPRTFSMKDFW